jgi:hypothetical protein
MTDIYNRIAGCGKSVQYPAHRLSRFSVERFRTFVKEKNTGTANQCPRESRLFLLTTREIGRTKQKGPAVTNHTADFPDPFKPAPLVHIRGMYLQRQRKILQDTLVCPQCRILKHKRTHVPEYKSSGTIKTIDIRIHKINRAGRRLKQTGSQFQQCGFTASGLTEKGRGRTPVYTKRHITDDLHIARTESDTLKSE